MRNRKAGLVTYYTSILTMLAMGSVAMLLWTQTPAAQSGAGQGGQNPPAQNPANSSAPAWAQPGSATHTQVAPPADFHRPSRNFETPLGVFEGQSDIGAALVPGSA
ncbi:MAG: hypothetical protein WBA18_01035, partial [Terracidiphilus sp.]